MAPLYYRNAAVAVVCFDIMDEESFQKMKDWVEELRTNVPEGKLVLAIACTKVREIEHLVRLQQWCVVFWALALQAQVLLCCVSFHLVGSLHALVGVVVYVQARLHEKHP